MISGFTMVRNADKLYFPIEPSLRSLLPLVDELIVALGEGDEDDRTKEIIASINDPKIKIFPRVWSEKSFKESKILAEETNFALDQCQGDWCIYLQADEVLHEKDYTTIRQAMQDYRNNDRVDGLLFHYYHFWGDYQHYLPFHGWYRNEIRIIKNNRQIHSIKDAQSFRKKDNKKLTVVPVEAHVYHYGWVRPPGLMQNKKKFHDGIHHGMDTADKMYSNKSNAYDYGPLGNTYKFAGTHPSTMQEWMKDIFWKDQLNYSSHWKPSRPLNKHEKMKYRILSWIENKCLGGKSIFGYKNWIRYK